MYFAIIGLYIIFKGIAPYTLTKSEIRVYPWILLSLSLSENSSW